MIEVIYEQLKKKLKKDNKMVVPVLFISVLNIVCCGHYLWIRIILQEIHFPVDQMMMINL